MKLEELWKRSTQMSPSQQQQWLKQELPEVLGKSGIWIAQKGTGRPDRVLVGIAAWVREELRLLDDTCATASALGLSLEVFLLDECESRSEIDEYIPGVGPVFQSPVVGVWEAGTLRESGSGRAGRDLLHEELLRRSRAS